MTTDVLYNCKCGKAFETLELLIEHQINDCDKK